MEQPSKMEHANSSPMLATVLSLFQQLMEDEPPATSLKSSSSACAFSNLLLSWQSADKTTEISTCDVSEAEPNEEEDRPEVKEEQTFENIWTSGQRVRKFPKLPVKKPTKVYRDEPAVVLRTSEPTTPVSENALPPNKGEVDLVALWNTAVAAESTPSNFESIWGGNQAGNRVRKFSPQRPRTVIPVSKAILPVVHRNALSPPPARRPTAPDLPSFQEDEHQEEEEETEVKPPKKTFVRQESRNRNRKSISVEPPSTLISPNAMEQVIHTNKIDTTDKTSSPRMPDLPVVSDSSIVSSPTNVPSEPKQPKSTQTLQKPNNPRRRLSEPLIEALSEEI